LQDAPMLALAVRQAWRDGAAVYVVGDDIALPCEFTTVAALDAVPLADAKKPVLICSVLHNSDHLPGVLEQYSQLKLSVIFPAANSYSAAQLAVEQGAVSLQRAVASGKIKGLISVEADIPAQLLAGIPFVAALDWRMTEAVQAAQIFLPTTAWVEMDGTSINNEGRAQRFKKVMNPGLPVRGLDPSGHPSHIHRTVPPGGEPQPAWQTLALFIERLSGEQVAEPFSGKWERLRQLDAGSEGVMIHDL